MTKRDMAQEIVKSVVWDGVKDVDWLVKHHTKEQIKDIYDMMLDAENDYWDNM